MSIDVAILGAGPYGLSVASHLRARGIDFRIFGRPMQSWRAHMPIGMHLKSEGFATNLSDPSATFTLKRFCIDRGLPYNSATAIPLDWFLAYGLAFQKRFVPEVEERSVLAVKRRVNGFDLAFQDGEVLAARRLLVAVGVHPFRDMPAATYPACRESLPPIARTMRSSRVSASAISRSSAAVHRLSSLGRCCMKAGPMSGW